MIRLSPSTIPTAPLFSCSDFWYADLIFVARSISVHHSVCVSVSLANSHLEEGWKRDGREMMGGKKGWTHPPHLARKTLE
jgi:hypothetical protein